VLTFDNNLSERGIRLFLIKESPMADEKEKVIEKGHEAPPDVIEELTDNDLESTTGGSGPGGGTGAMLVQCFE
jgi:hypothetical protein